MRLRGGCGFCFLVGFLFFFVDFLVVLRGDLDFDSVEVDGIDDEG